MKIMIVDDEKDIGLILGGEFQGQGHETVSLTSVREAIRYLEERPVDVVICEFEMPELNGMTLFSWLRLNRPHVPFYILTGVPLVDNEKILELGVKDILFKPQDLVRITQLFM